MKIILHVVKNYTGHTPGIYPPSMQPSQHVNRIVLNKPLLVKDPLITNSHWHAFPLASDKFVVLSIEPSSNIHLCCFNYLRVRRFFSLQKGFLLASQLLWWKIFLVFMWRYQQIPNWRCQSYGSQHVHCQWYRHACGFDIRIEGECLAVCFIAISGFKDIFPNVASDIWV